MGSEHPTVLAIATPTPGCVRYVSPTRVLSQEGTLKKWKEPFLPFGDPQMHF